MANRAAAEPHAAPLSGAAALARSDFRWVVVATLAAYLLASVFNLHEALARLPAALEVLQVDELPTTLMVLWLGLAWYAWRRWQECARLLARNRELARQLIAVQERERLALARELHDELAQHCTTIRIEAAYLGRAGDTTSIRAAAARAAESAGHLLTSVREMLRRLRPAELDELGLAAALQALAVAHQRRWGVSCSLAVDGSLDDLRQAIDIAAYRVVQEALANVARHARARHVFVTVGRSAAALSVRVVDDGCGFDPDLRTQGLGLLGAGERVAALGGSLTVRSTLGAGTALCVTIPLANAPEPRRNVAKAPA